MRLSRFPRVRFCHCPTPLEPMKNLTKLLAGPTLFIKRDDCTGLATGGNKTRKLEFLIADALQNSADTVVTHGAVQSNHVRQTAAAAAKTGLKCEILLERRVGETDENYETSGNVLIDRLCGANVHFQAAGSDMEGACEQAAEEVRQIGKTPYVIPGGGSNRVGALGYVNCALELVQQANDAGVRIDYVVHATGSSGTQAGLLTGFEGCSSGIKLLGVTVSRPRAEQEDMVYDLATETADFVGVRDGVARSSVVANSDYYGPGYGVPTPEMVEAVKLTARHEGILLDPVYSGKGMAGLIGLTREGFFTKDDNVVFLHTGGAVALFAYQQSIFTE